MCPIRRNSLLVHVAYPQILGTNGLVVVVVVFPEVKACLNQTFCPNSMEMDFGVKSFTQARVYLAKCVTY